MQPPAFVTYDNNVLSGFCPTPTPCLMDNMKLDRIATKIK